MAKAPADQFYYADWLRDTELQKASAASRGIWMNLLAHMWFSDERGTVTGFIDELARLGNSTTEEFDKFLAQLKRLKFGDVTNCNNELTITNRRMRKDELERQGTRLRVQKHRKRQSNDEVTPPSSSTSPSPASSTAKKELKKDPKTKGAADPNGSKNGSKDLGPQAINAMRGNLVMTLSKAGYWNESKACLSRLERFIDPLVTEAKSKDTPLGWFLDVAPKRMNEQLEKFKPDRAELDAVEETG